MLHQTHSPPSEGRTACPFAASQTVSFVQNVTQQEVPWPHRMRFEFNQVYSQYNPILRIHEDATRTSVFCQVLTNHC
jgi:hypothetical protein